MIEKIGKVTLNLEDYPGEDLYSDGKVEDELLEIAMTYDPEDFDRVVAERKSWPVMYHFSSIRQNILSWYPGFEGKRVLEIGSGCGAVTGAAAGKAKSVTCVELSKKRSLINAWRNRNCGNIEIRLGNFEDVEKKLPADYDVITLIGVFEYGVNYIHSAHPYEDFLKTIRTHLAPGGEVLIAIENRLGLKYFAGCTEDHTGGFFDGIEGYTGTNYVRTFSRGELADVCRASGFESIEFYYPYPDYKFPMSVYSDEYLPKTGELRNNIVNFDRRRLVLFDEAKAFDSFAGSGLFREFSNSFFVVLKDGRPAASPKILFTKFSNERSSALAIRTDIVEADGHKRAVRKAPCTAKAADHIAALERQYRSLQEAFRGTRFSPNRMKTEDGAVLFEYLEGETLEEVFDRRYLKDETALADALLAYLDEIGKTAGESFRETAEFRDVFGSASSLKGQPSAASTDIDMVLNNILLSDDDRWNVIDYEWTFSFPIPMNFVKWRVLHYYIEGNTKRFFLRDTDLLTRAGLSDGEISVYEEMERHFQSYIEGERTPLRELYADISEGAADLPAILKRMSGTRGENGSAKIYFDTGRGFGEDETAVIEHLPDGSFAVSAPLEGVKQLRIDPAEYAGYVSVEDIGTELGPIDPASVESNGVRLDLRRWLFDTDDPFLVVSSIPADARFFYAHLKMVSMDVDSAEFMRKELDARDRRILALMGTNRKKEDLLAWRGEVIRQMMKSTPMKAYRKLRVKAKRKDPYAMLRPLLPSDPNGILYCIDHAAHRNHEFVLRGWCFDRDYSSERVFVVNAKDEEIPAEIKRYRRPDASKQFDLPEERETGFTVSIPYEIINNPPLYLEVENPRGYTCEKLEIELDPEKRAEANEKLREKEGGSHEISGYDDWAHDHAPSEEELQRQRKEKTDPSLLFSIVVPLYRTDRMLLKELVDSVLSQTCGSFELILSDGSGADSPLTAHLDRLAEKDPRIRPIHNGKKLGISENTNIAINASRGNWIVFADHDDVLAPDALYELARCIREHSDAELIYTDEDKILPGGVLGQPVFKPDFNPDLLTNVNYICHLTAASRELIERAGMPDSAFDGAQDYDFVLRCTEQTDKIEHIQKVLYHWRMTESSTAADPAAKDYAFAAGARAVSAHLKRMGIDAQVTRGPKEGIYRVRETIHGEPLISVVIPNKDHKEDLLRCISSIEEKSSWKNLEYVIVENNSEEAETFTAYEELAGRYERVRVIRYEGSFNYSAINNLGAKEAKGDYLLFLNNDTELIAPDSIGTMLGVCQRPDVGAVGARLYFEDGSIQHAGVVLGYGGIAGHAFREFGPKETGYMNLIIERRDVSAVTAACMLVKRSVFEEAGGFHEGLAVAFNDIDLCMKITEAGYRIVYEPYAEFRHYESKSRGYEDTPGKQERFKSEVRVFQERWGERIAKGDPFYNPNLTLERPDYTLQ